MTRPRRSMLRVSASDLQISFFRVVLPTAMVHAAGMAQGGGLSLHALRWRRVNRLIVSGGLVGASSAEAPHTNERTPRQRRRFVAQVG